MNFLNFQSMLATPTILVILLMKLMAIRVDPFRVFFFKDEGIPCDTKSPLIFSMWLSWVIYVGPAFWLVLQQEYWEHILVHEFHGWKFVISWDVARLVCMERSLKCDRGKIDVGVQSADPDFQFCLKLKLFFLCRRRCKHTGPTIITYPSTSSKHGKNMKKNQHHNQIHFRYQYKQNKEEEEEQQQQQQWWWQWTKGTQQ